MQITTLPLLLLITLTTPPTLAEEQASAPDSIGPFQRRQCPKKPKEYAVDYSPCNYFTHQCLVKPSKEQADRKCKEGGHGHAVSTRNVSVAPYFCYCIFFCCTPSCLAVLRRYVFTLVLFGKFEKGANNKYI